MATAQQNGFDGRKLAELIGLIDSPVDAEVAGAVHRIRVLKKKHGDVPFFALIESDEYKTAVWGKYGGCAAPCAPGGKCHHGPEIMRAWFETKHNASDNAALVEARTLIETLRKDNAQLEKDGAALALAVKQREETINALRGKLATARPASPQAADTSGPVMTFLDGLVGFVAIAFMFVGLWHLGALGLEWVRSFF